VALMAGGLLAQLLPEQQPEGEQNLPPKD